MAKLTYELSAYDELHYGRTNMFSVWIERIPEAEIAVVSVSGLLGYQLGVLTVNNYNEPAKLAEKPELNEVSLVLHDNLSKKTVEDLWRWFTQVYDPETRRMGVPRDYKCDGELKVYTTKGELVRSFKLQGLWPSAVDLGEYSYENAELTQVTATLQVDRVILGKGGGH